MTYNTRAYAIANDVQVADSEIVTWPIISPRSSGRSYPVRSTLDTIKRSTSIVIGIQVTDFIPSIPFGALMFYYGSETSSIACSTTEKSNLIAIHFDDNRIIIATILVPTKADPIEIEAALTCFFLFFQSNYIG